MLARSSLLKTVVIFVAMLGLAVSAFADGTLFIGTDTEEFSGILPDRLGKYTTTGPVIGPGVIIPLDYPLNGMGNGSGFLYAGDALSNTLRTIDYNGGLLTSIPAGFLSGCCNEEMVVAIGSEVVGTGTLFHAHYLPGGGTIDLIDPITGAVVASYAQDEVVGMARVGTDIWISKWSPMQVGTWDPATNTFTLMFNTATQAGGLAYDEASDVLWVGRQGGFVGPFDLLGNSLGAEIQPFGPSDDTIDGLVLVCAPTVTGATADPSVLWPPNHKMVDVTIDYTVASCEPTTCTLSVSSNEPVNDLGDGNTSPDWEVVDATHVSLRAERSGTGTGRIYTIDITCTDQLGQTGTASVMVTVPHDQRP